MNMDLQPNIFKKEFTYMYVLEGIASPVERNVCQYM